MNASRRITEARLKRLETETEHDPAWFALLAAEVRRLRALIATCKVQDGGFLPSDFETEQLAIRQEQNW